MSVFKCPYGHREEEDEGIAVREQWTIKFPVTMGEDRTRVWVERLTSCRRLPPLLQREGGS